MNHFQLAGNFHFIRGKKTDFELLSLYPHPVRSCLHADLIAGKILQFFKIFYVKLGSALKGGDRMRFPEWGKLILRRLPAPRL